MVGNGVVVLANDLNLCDLRADDVLCQAIETSLPSLIVLFSNRNVADTLVGHDDFCALLARFKAYGNHFRSIGFGFYFPGIDQLRWRLDDAVLPGDPNILAVGKPVPNTVSAPYAQIHCSIDAGNAFRAPPLFKALRLRPGCE